MDYQRRVDHMQEQLNALTKRLRSEKTLKEQAQARVHELGFHIAAGTGAGAGPGAAAPAPAAPPGPAPHHHHGAPLAAHGVGGHEHGPPHGQQLGRPPPALFRTFDPHQQERGASLFAARRPPAAGAF